MPLYRLIKLSTFLPELLTITPLATSYNPQQSFPLVKIMDLYDLNHLKQESYSDLKPFSIIVLLVFIAASFDAFKSIKELQEVWGLLPIPIF